MKLTQLLIFSMLTASMTVYSQTTSNKKIVRIVKKKKTSEKVKNSTPKNLDTSIKTETGYYCPPCGKG